MNTVEALNLLEQLAETSPKINQQAAATVIAGCATAHALREGLGGGNSVMGTSEALVHISEALGHIARSLDSVASVIEDAADKTD